MNTVKLMEFGQSPWLDNIERSFVRSGGLQRMVEREGLRGITSNPTIFDKAISRGTSYEYDIQRLAAQNKTTEDIYEQLASDDIREAAAMLRPIYESSDKVDGYVSLEPPSQYACDLERTMSEVPRYFRMVNAPNVMIKVPGTVEGVAAVRRLIASGINTNVTLIFSPSNYAIVAQSYIDGLQELYQRGGDLARVASVASVFVSRIDTAVDKKLQGLIATEKSATRRKELEGLLGKAAIANSQVIYQAYRRRFAAPDFKYLGAKGAKPQRLLWGSTSTKNPAYSDVKYIDSLIGQGTINTIPPETWAAFNDHGTVRQTMAQDASSAHKVLDQLEEVGICMDEVYASLQKDGISAFTNSLDSLMAHLDQKRKAMIGATR
ncbi:MAG: transaldolase [Chloroflexi bacterium]|nr:transaldolase [Chloroflexota bacterium]